MKGWLTKKGGLTWKKRYFELKDANHGLVIVYYAKEGDTKIRGELPINSETRISDLPNKRNGFQAISNKKALVVYAENEETRAKWKDAILLVIEEINNVAELDKPRLGHHFFSSSGTRFEMEKKYELIKPVGCGAYGTVISATNTETGDKVAVKKIEDAFEDLVDAKRIVREVRKKEKEVWGQKQHCLIC